MQSYGAIRMSLSVGSAAATCTAMPVPKLHPAIIRDEKPPVCSLHHAMQSRASLMRSFSVAMPWDQP